MVRPSGVGMLLVMRLRALKDVTKVTLMPILTRRLANWRDGLIRPWPGNVTMRM